MAFSYDPTTPLGYVRLLISDVDPKEYTFSDAELTAFLNQENQNVHLAAARAYGTITRSRALLSARIQREGYSSQEQALSDLRQLVKDLEELANTSGGLQTADFSVTSEHFEGYRPGWRNVNSRPVVE
jgi:hypothetical protein